MTSPESFPCRGKISTSKRDASAHYSMGIVMQERHKHRLAITEFESAVQLDPCNAAAYNGLGVSLDAMEQYTRAQAAYLAALSIDPDYDIALNNLGYSYLLQSRYELAVNSFKRALAIDSENEKYRNNLGLAYVRSGKEDAAFATFLSSGDEAEAHLNMARIYYREGNYDGSTLHFTKAANIKPSDPAGAKGLAATTSLAKIRLDVQTQPVRSKDEDQEGEEDTLVAGYDRDGFATIPASAIEELEVIEIDQVQMATSGNRANLENGQPIYMVSLAQAADPEKPQTTHNALETDNKKTLDETQALKVLSSETSDKIEKTRKRVKIEVSNGNGVRHMAKNVGHYLTGKGFILMYLSNADHFNHVGTCIYYTKEYLEEAYRLSQELPGQQTLEEVQAIRNGNAVIRVRIGRDLKSYLGTFELG